MRIIYSRILSNQINLIFGFSTKLTDDNDDKFNFNMSYYTGDDKNLVDKNREKFYTELGLTTSSVAFQKQIHSDIVKIVTKAGYAGECDAVITKKKNLGLAVSSADCCAIFLFDKKENVIAGVHSGWRGTVKKILNTTLSTLSQQFDCKPENIIAYISPSISQKNYEVGGEVAEQFDNKYLKSSGDKYLLNVSGVNKQMLSDFGIPEQNIEQSDLCSFDNDYLHSFRRDREQSGRALGVIALNDF